MEDPQPQILFEPNDWIVDKHNPAKLGQYTGRFSRAGAARIMIELIYPDGSRQRRPLDVLEKHSTNRIETIDDKLESGSYGKLDDLRRLITFEKLKGTLHEVVYSMEAAQIDFYPYQFKPVLKFINSPSERLILADEVGLGKTIEAALIWLELQARRQARRLLVVCPKILTEKWKNELRDKFLLDARIVGFDGLKEEIAALGKSGDSHASVLIASYTGLRPTKKELRALSDSDDPGDTVSARTRLLHQIRHWDATHPPFDLVIFDEAHYMRNAGTSTFHLGESLTSHLGTAVLCVSATPVNNSNTDLHSLLRLIDPDFFETQGMFDELLEANRPTIQTINALSQPTIHWEEVLGAVRRISESPYTRETPLFKKLLEVLDDFRKTPHDREKLAIAQDLAEKINLLGSYVNRTRRVQVEEMRPVRRPKVLTVDYLEEEMKFYRIIVELVKRQCRKDIREFHIFHALGIQLRVASCLPALVAELKSGRMTSLKGELKDISELLSDNNDEDAEDFFDSFEPVENNFSDIDLRILLEHDFEAGDSKYRQLADLLANMHSSADGQDQIQQGEKLVIFSFYRATLSYLQRRLQAEGHSVAVIHGGIPHDDRWTELNRFKDPRGPRILLSSEVGSEGLDLQFCRIVVNYDLPWNPMRVEQRIGRIDRVGQKSPSLIVVNFKVRDTVEERLYDRLHSKLLLSSNSLGDLEAIIGEEVQRLTIDLLSGNLTPEEETIRIERAERVIAERKRLTCDLEEKGESLVALNDYLQSKVREDYEKGRYLQADELREYLLDFFERNFPGTEISHNDPAEGCMRLKLSFDAFQSLSDFIKEDRTLAARELKRRDFAITFGKDTIENLAPGKRKELTFINHLSPLIRWITSINQESTGNFYPVAACELSGTNLPPGIYCYRVERFLLKGIQKRESMNYRVMRIGDPHPLSSTNSERAFQNLLRNSRNWDYVNAPKDYVMHTHAILRETLEHDFDDAVLSFEAENETIAAVRKTRAEGHWDRIIDQSKQAISTLKFKNRPEYMIRARETRLSNEIRNKEERLAEIRRSAYIDPTPSEVAAGIFKVT